MIINLAPYENVVEENGTQTLRFRDFLNALSRAVNTSVYSISAAHTTAGNELLLASAALTVTLNAAPAEGERVTVKRVGTGLVTVDGGGALIDGTTTTTLPTIYDSVSLVFVDQWFIV